MPKSKYSFGLEGKQFSRWTVVSFSHLRRESRKSIAYYWLCRCSCGNEKAVNARLLQRGKSTSCGCYIKETNGQQGFKHGHNPLHGPKSPEYNSWDHMIQRTTNPKHNKSWHRYGGRGIVVCEGFRQFTNFLKVVGLKPSPIHSIDRINNNRNYSCGECAQCFKEQWPMNCRWATPKEQSANTFRAPQYQSA